ncbi:MAG: tyrosine-type recombinase/integrase, partial [Verrucomicrobiota bacterium]
SAARDKITATQARKIISDIHRQVTGSDLIHFTLRAYVDQWRFAKKGTISPSTFKAYETATNDLCSSLGERADADLVHITSSDIMMFRNSIAKSTSASTANLRLKIVRIVFQQAWREGLITDNPAAKVSILKNDRTGEARRGFTLDELKILLSEASGEWKGLILFGLYTGQRLGDLARLCWGNIDRTQGTLVLNTRKTDRRQILPLAEPLLHWVEKNHSAQEAKAPLFPMSSAAAEASGTVGTLSNQFQKILTRCGLSESRSHEKKEGGKGRSGSRAASELSFHSLRHTATSLMKNAGISPALVQEFVGHDSKTISQNYTHIDLQALRTALSGLPDIG